MLKGMGLKYIEVRKGETGLLGGGRNSVKMGKWEPNCTFNKQRKQKAFFGIFLKITLKPI